FAPEPALRVRWNTNTDTPLPPDTPAGQNPPDGAIFNYYLKVAANGPVILEIMDSAGKLVRRHSTTDPVPQLNPDLAIPAYWLRPPHPLASITGFHRFVCDMHYAPVPGIKPEYPIAAVPWNTAPAPTSPWVMPGNYTLVLTVDGQKYSQPMTVRWTRELRRRSPICRSNSTSRNRCIKTCWRFKRSLTKRRPLARSSRLCARKPAAQTPRRSMKPARVWSRWRAAEADGDAVRSQKTSPACVPRYLNCWTCSSLLMWLRQRKRRPLSPSCTSR